MKRFFTFLLLVIAVAMTLTVWLFDLTEVSRRVFGHLLGWGGEIRTQPEIFIDPEIQHQMDAVSEERTRAILSDLTSLGSRVVGYPGNRRAYEYLRAAFEEMGLEDVTTDTFRVTVPVDKGAALMVCGTGEEIPLFCLWPNEVRTPTLPRGGVTGPLIYGKKGDFAAFNGLPVEGNIVLMDFDCDQKYVNPRMLGARAILFGDNGLVSRGQAEQKFLEVPADIPRFWVEKPHVPRLLELAKQRAEVTVTGTMVWEEVDTWNLYGYIRGSDEDMPTQSGERPRKWKDQIIVLEAYYDAMSVVPALAPGAENACGMAALLQVARALKAYGPKYSVLVLASSGHFKGLSGVNDFLHRHSRESDYFRKRMPERDRIDFRLFVGLDLSSHDERVAAFAQGTYYTGWTTDNYRKNMLLPYAERFSKYAEEMFADQVRRPRFIDAIAPTHRTWKHSMSIPLAFNSDAAVYVGKHGITLATPDDSRDRIDTPEDRLEYVDISKLTRQIQTIVPLMLRASRDPAFFPDSRLFLRDRGRDLTGRVYLFDRDVNFFVPKRKVPGAIVRYGDPRSRGGVRTMIATMTDEEGRFRFENLRHGGAVKLSAYKIDEDGRIVMAPDLGEDGDKSYPLSVNPSRETETMVVLFECRAMTLFEIVDSRYLFALDSMNLLGTNDAPLQWYGTSYVPNQSRSEGRVTPAAVAFAKPGQRVKVFMSTGVFGIKYLLTHAPEDLLIHPIQKGEVTEAVKERARGEGYLIDEGIVTIPSYKVARDMWILNDVRLKELAQYGVENRKVAALHEEAREALFQAKHYLEHLEYDKFMAAARKACGLEARAYPDVKATANDTVKGVIFYFALLLPFSFFCERLFFGFTDIRKKIAGFAGIFVSVFLIMHFVHPAFKLSTSPYIIFLAFVILALGCIVAAMLTGKANQALKRMKRSARETHTVDVGRISATATAVSLGISNLRRRKLRTALTAVTIILLTFTTLSFTSVITSLEFYKLPRDNKPLYQGALLRSRSWKGLQLSTLEYLKSAFQGKAILAPRAWLMAPIKTERAYIDFKVPFTGKRSFANGLLGIMPAEVAVTGVDSLLVRGRWFREGEREVCILPEGMAAIVGIRPEDVGSAQIQMFGRAFTVVGLMDSKRFNELRDLDDERLTPVDTVSESGKMVETPATDPNVVAAEPIEEFIHLEADNTMLLPYAFVMEIGGTLQSVAMAFPGGDFIGDVEAFMSRVALTMFVGKGDKVVVYSSTGTTMLKGLGNLVVPILIAALIVLNTMLGSVYERIREIGIYSSLGLAPVHIGALFMAEAAVFATVGAVMGYLVGQVLTLMLSSWGLLSGMTLNYSSLSAVSSTLIVMATVFLSTAYPAKKAADMAVPDVTRKWEFPEPEGDDWRFDFPFTVGGTEALGIYTYLTRIFESYGEGSTGAFLTEGVRLSALPVRVCTQTGLNDEGETRYQIAMNTWLMPYDLGISQSVRLDAIPTGEFGLYRIVVLIHRLSGDVASWKRINRGFLNVIRKHFLVWRMIPQGTKDEYAEEGRRVLDKGN